MDVNLTSQKYRVLIISKKKCELMRFHKCESNVFCIGTDQLWFSIQDQSSIKITDFSPYQMQSLNLQFSSVQFSHSVVSDSLRPHESQHARPPCLSPTPGVHSDSRPSGQWCQPAISSSVIPFSSCPQSLPASESFPVSQLFAWRGQSTGVSALASFLSKNTES